MTGDPGPDLAASLAGPSTPPDLDSGAAPAAALVRDDGGDTALAFPVEALRGAAELGQQAAALAQAFLALPAVDPDELVLWLGHPATGLQLPLPPGVVPPAHRSSWPSLLMRLALPELRRLLAAQVDQGATARDAVDQLCNDLDLMMLAAGHTAAGGG